MPNFKVGSILYFDPFYFKNGNIAKPKYFVVLANTESDNILASLPTRTDSIPTDLMKTDGCIEDASINFNCFVFSNKTTVTQCSKCFDFPTHVYGYQIDIYDKTLMNELYQIEGSDYEVWGEMKSELFKELLECLKNSGSVKRKFVRILSN